MKLTMKLLALFFGALMFANIANAESPREQLVQMVEQLQKTPNDNALRENIIKLAQELKPAPAVPEEAERRMVRGAAAFKGAKSVADYRDAAQEFEQATFVAPWYGDAYLNLGVAQDKAENYEAALRSLNLALLATPNDKEIKALIYEVEYRKERAIRGDFQPYTATKGEFKVSFPVAWKVDSQSFYKGAFSRYVFKKPDSTERALIILWYQRWVPIPTVSGALDMFADSNDYINQNIRRRFDKYEREIIEEPRQMTIEGHQYEAFVGSQKQKNPSECKHQVIEMCNGGVYRFAALNAVSGFYVLIGVSATSSDQAATEQFKEFVKSFVPLKAGPEGIELKAE